MLLPMNERAAAHYFDNAATTPVDPDVLAAMEPYFLEHYGNASSFHRFGQTARRAVEDARGRIAEAIGFGPEEIVFTSGATEADNLALIGLFHKRSDRRHIITCATEHHAVLHACDWLESQGARVTRLGVDDQGRVDPDAVAAALDDDALMVSIMAGNNEIGTLHPLERIAEICRERGVPFHTDAVQAFGKVPLRSERIDLLSLSAHKFHGPKGVGILAVRNGISLAPIVHGGGHEAGRRSGTENVPGIVGMGVAAETAAALQATEARRMGALRERLIEALSELPNTRQNGSRHDALPHIVNVSFAGIEGESLVMRLDAEGIAASTGSACSSPSLEASHVLLAIGVPLAMAHGSLRISLGRYTTEDDVDALLRALPSVVERLRTISPFKAGECDVQ
jgi:cysteine desulfurase